MSTTLDNFISTRRAEIKASLAALKAELKALDAAEQAISALVPQSAERRTRQRSATAAPTIKNMVASVLFTASEGGDANKIREMIRGAFNTEVSRPSLSPQLSRMKSDDELTLNEHDNVWRLTPIGIKNYRLEEEPDWDIIGDDARMEESLAREPK